MTGNTTQTQQTFERICNLISEKKLEVYVTADKKRKIIEGKGWGLVHIFGGRIIDEIYMWNLYRVQ